MFPLLEPLQEVSGCYVLCVESVSSIELETLLQYVSGCYLC